MASRTKSSVKDTTTAYDHVVTRHQYHVHTFLTDFAFVVAEDLGRVLCSYFINPEAQA